MLFLIVVIGAAVAFYRVATYEDFSPLVLCFLSIAISFLSPAVIPIPGFIAALVGQVVLFIGVTVYKMVTGKV